MVYDGLIRGIPVRLSNKHNSCRQSDNQKQATTRRLFEVIASLLCLFEDRAKPCCFLSVCLNIIPHQNETQVEQQYRREGKRAQEEGACRRSPFFFSHHHVDTSTSTTTTTG